MSSWIAPIISWLVELYLLSTVVLGVAGVALRMLRQPSRRLAVARAALVSLLLLGPLTAGSRWMRSERVQVLSRDAAFAAHKRPFWQQAIGHREGR